MSGYVLLVIELAVILAICAVLAFLLGLFVGKKLAQKNQAREQIMAPRKAAMSSTSAADSPWAPGKPTTQSAPDALQPTSAAAASPQGQPKSGAPGSLPGDPTQSQSAGTLAAAASGVATTVVASGEPASNYQAADRIKELEEQLKKQEIEMARLEAGATTAWDTTMPQLLERIDRLESELKEKSLENSELKARLDIEQDEKIEKVSDQQTAMATAESSLEAGEAESSLEAGESEPQDNWPKG